MKRKRLKRRFNSKGKGSAFERKVCVQLSLWITNGKSKDCFWRSSMSGGRATIHVAKGGVNRQAGDIAAVSPEAHVLTDHYFIECKAVRDLHIPGFILSNVGPLARFWKKAREQAAEHGRTPMLIAKQNNQPVLVITTPGADYVGLRCVVNRPNEPIFLIYLFDEMLSNTFKATVERNGPSHQRPHRPTVRQVTRHRLTPDTHQQRRDTVGLPVRLRKRLHGSVG